jgi:hypothetical protein
MGVAGADAEDFIGGGSASGGVDSRESLKLEPPNRPFRPFPRRLLSFRPTCTGRASSPSDWMWMAEVDWESGDGVVFRRVCDPRVRGGLDCRRHVRSARCRKKEKK